MVNSPIDTNVIIRFLMESPATIPVKLRGVFSFLGKLEREEICAFLPDLVLFQSFFVLTSYYEVPSKIAAEKLARLVAFRGINMSDKHIVLDCLKQLQEGSTDLVDAWLVAWCKYNECDGIFTFDSDIQKAGLKMLPVK
jgi:predicted nucleic-acid-binding protein